MASTGASIKPGNATTNIDLLYKPKPIEKRSENSSIEVFFRTTMSRERTVSVVS